MNAVAPQALTNREFTTVLGRVLGRPTLLPLPALAARSPWGKWAEALLLASTRVEPSLTDTQAIPFAIQTWRAGLPQYLLGENLMPLKSTMDERSIRHHWLSLTVFLVSCLTVMARSLIRDPPLLGVSAAGKAGLGPHRTGSLILSG